GTVSTASSAGIASTDAGTAVDGRALASVSAVDLSRAVADLIDRERALLHPGHPRRAAWHSRQRDAADRRPLGQQPLDDRRWHMPLDDVASDHHGMAALEIFGHAVFVADRGHAAADDFDLEALAPQVPRIFQAAAAV